MKADYWRQGVATILTAGILAVGAVAQEGAEGEVNITESTPTATSEAQPAAAPAKPIKPQIVDRDPFVNLLLTGNVISSSVSSRAPARSIKPRTPAPAVKSAQSGSTVAAAAPAEEEPEVEIPAPEVSVTGIVSSGSGNQAIISTSVGMKVISVGQKLGDYRVAAINPTSVVFSYGGQKTFKVPLESEF